MSDISSRELRNNTASVLRRVEAGERVRVLVNRRPVAELVPLDRPLTMTGAELERIRREAPLDAGFLDELRAMRDQRIEPPAG